VLRHDDDACQGKKCGHFQEGCSHWVRFSVDCSYVNYE
jgi:hypothetical protein